MKRRERTHALMAVATLVVGLWRSFLRDEQLELLLVEGAEDMVGFSRGRAPPSLWGDDEPTVAACTAAGITYSAYSPLGGVTKYDVLHDPVATAIGAAHNRSSAQVALRYLTQRGIPLITASDKEAHVASDLASFELTLSDGEMAALIAA